MAKRRGKWTREELLGKIREWAEAYDAPPSVSDWNPSMANRSASLSAARASAWMERAIRFAEGEWPWHGTVVKVFGSWNAGIREAGFDPRDAPRVLNVRELAAGDLAHLDQLVARARRSAEAGREHELRLLLYRIAEDAIKQADRLAES